ncbi:MAG: hypothetical protein KQI81_07310 [Deltaproteobacteria bacterium]|nr:hypothetical protein [Deltaproteobacteria bacterium]
MLRLPAGRIRLAGQRRVLVFLKVLDERRGIGVERNIPGSATRCHFSSEKDENGSEQGGTDYDTAPFIGLTLKGQF